MLKPLLLVAAALAVTATAKADKIYFKAATSDKSQATGQAPDPIVGKVIGENAKSITIRVDGGEITVDKSLVARVVKDDTTVADIVKEEAKEPAKAKSADAARRAEHRQWVEASVARASKKAVAAPRETTIEVDFKGVLPTQTIRVYNPVLHRVDERQLGQVVEGYLSDQLRDAPSAGLLQGRDPYVFYKDASLRKRSPGRLDGPNPYEGYKDRRLQQGVERNRKHMERLARLRAARVKR